MPKPGCLSLFVALAVLIVLPLLFVDFMATALERLGLSPGVAGFLVLAIILGSVINIPVHRIARDESVVLEVHPLFGFARLVPPPRSLNDRSTIVAVNLGGCVIPCAIALHEIVQVAGHGVDKLLLLVAITVVNVVVCYRVARPVKGMGIAMPALIPPIVAVIPAVLLFAPEHAPPAAFVAGTLGPLVGADLLHMKEIGTIDTPFASIGGAGTFDGIVLSGIFAAFLAY